jgi:hypothetical protein
VREDVDALETSTASITEGAPLTVVATSGLEDASEDFPAAAGTTSAQLSALGAGVFSVAVMLLVLAVAALAARRQREIEMLRSRGASLGLLAAHAGGEAVAVAAIGLAVGAGGTMAVIGSPNSVVLLGVTVGVALISPVVAALGQVVTVPAVTRVRAVAVALTATSAVLALVALRSRGSGSGETVDPLAFVAPVLCAAVVAIAIAPLPALLARPLRRVVVLTRGAGSLIAVAGTARAGSVLTLTTLTLAVSVAMTSFVLGQSVAAAQEDNAWRAVGADVRIDDVDDPRHALTVFDAENVAAAAVVVIHQAILRGKEHSSSVTLLAVDDRYADLLAAMPDDQPPRQSASAVTRLTDTSAATAEAGSVPALLDARLTRAPSDEPLFIELGDIDIPLELVDSPIAPPRFVTDSVVIVDQAVLESFLASESRDMSAELPPSTVLAVGPGAEDVDLEGLSGTVLKRHAVLDQERRAALPSGLATATQLSLVGAGALAVIGLLLISVIGAARRGRTVALLKALGVPPRAGTGAAMGELAPVVVGAVVGGALASAIVLGVAGRAFGLGSNGAPDIAVVVPWQSIAGTAVAAVLFLTLAILVDAPISRRTETSTILRSGEEI